MKFLDIGDAVINLDKVVFFDITQLEQAVDPYGEFDDYGHRIDREKKTVSVTMEGNKSFCSSKPAIVKMFEALRERSKIENIKDEDQ